eukprot:PhF_6_TR11745/c0_g1_i1/m.19213
MSWTHHPQSQTASSQPASKPFFQSLMETMVLMTQESILCQSCARVGVSTKHTYGHNKYWLLVQTRSTSAMVESNVTCRYLINVNVIESKPFVMGMAVVLAVCGVMILGTTLSYLSFILSPRFTVFPWTGSFAFVFMLLPNELLVLFMWIGQQAWRGASWMYEKLKAVLPDRHQQHHRTDGTSERALITPHRNHVEVNIVDDVEMAPLSASVTDNAVVSIGGGGEEGRTATTSIHSTPQQQDITPPPSTPSITEGTATNQNHEDDEDDVIACRICRDDTNAEELIQPCRCTGSMAYVHRSCLDKWRSQCLARNSINSSRCEVCHSPFMLSIQYNMMDVAIRMASNKFPKAVKKVALGLLMWAVVVLFGCMCDAVLGFITCNAEWHEVVTPNHENIVQVHVVGFFYYSFFSWVMYNAAYFAWLLAVNTNLHGEVPELLTLGRQIFRTVSFALISAVWGSYLLKFVLFMVSELVVWDWELGLTTGTFVMLMIVGLLGTIMQSRELFLRRLRRFLWHRRGRRQQRRGARVDVLEDGEEDTEHGENHEEGHNDDVEEENHNEEVAMHPVHDQPTEETIHS